MTGGGWGSALEDALRAMTGGLVVGVPLFYTMEVWAIGETSEPWYALALLGATVVPVFALVATGGFRRRPDLTSGDVLMDTIEAMGLAIVVAAMVLVVLQQITLATPVETIATSVVFEAMPFAIGAAVATQFLQHSRGEEQDEGSGDGEQHADGDERTADDRRKETVADLGAAAVGATVVALSIAPTDEVPVLSGALETPWLLVVIAFSVVASYGIVFVAGFGDQRRRHEQEGVLQRPATETMAAYLVSLVVSALLLLAYSNLPLDEPLTALSHAVVLSLPASVGGAAGRLVV